MFTYIASDVHNFFFICLRSYGLNRRGEATAAAAAHWFMTRIIILKVTSSISLYMCLYAYRRRWLKAFFSLCHLWKGRLRCVCMAIYLNVPSKIMLVNSTRMHTVCGFVVDPSLYYTHSVCCRPIFFSRYEIVYVYFNTSKIPALAVFIYVFILKFIWDFNLIGLENKSFSHYIVCYIHKCLNFVNCRKISVIPSSVHNGD